MIVLGINAYHGDVSAALLVDGQLVAAIEEERFRRVHFPHSLGLLYLAVTQYLGFPKYGDEYKVMGLAPYGAPEFVDELRRLVRLTRDGGFELDLSYFLHHRGDVPMTWDDGEPTL